ncbi:hypothetical protein K7472_30975 [Streptomyces sp. PTM05]|uniref:Uncharacterized protein n=1 Tax=Streptantibioticus parmotrematis TaxID=2873249 RepID=A0ABS7R1B4_9ACTN|nr:hypothetical protein [Streptantibioticus parmotrematis]MBY8889237.1 hypothetical protein [Streptantibioticus parmotrematis]
MEVWTMAKAVVTSRYYLLRERMKTDDRGITTTEVALITGALLAAAGLLVVAIKAKLAEKIGIINSG